MGGQYARYRIRRVGLLASDSGHWLFGVRRVDKEVLVPADCRVHIQIGMREISEELVARSRHGLLSPHELDPVDLVVISSPCRRLIPNVDRR